MKVKVRIVRKILDDISGKTGFTQDFTGFKEMSDIIGLQNHDYLYTKMHLKIQKKSDPTEIGIGRLQLNLIAKYLGFDTFHELHNHLTRNLSPQLRSLIGAYYCYVRANLEQGIILRSPVKIFEKDQKAFFELKGPANTYAGEMSTKDGCLFTLMTSNEGKVFHHVYKIGNRISPKVLQGVFSGVSTAFDPIGGRTLLIKQDKDFDALSNQRSEVSNLRKSRHEEEQLVGRYFKEYKNNNVAPNKSTTFTLDDLNG